MTVLDELHALIKDLRVHIEQEYPCLQPLEKVVSKPKALPPPSAFVPKKEAKKVELVPAIAPKLEPKPKPVIVEKAAPPPKQAPTQTVPKILQALNRPFIKPQPLLLTDCLAAFDKLGIPHIKEPEADAIVIEKEVAFVSFFPPGSEVEQFIQKVASSVHERLMPCRVFTQPGLSAAALCHTLACQGSLKALIIAYSQEESPKLATWLHYFGDDITATTPTEGVLPTKRSLFTSPLCELMLTPSQINDVEFKKTLWKALQGT